MTWLLHSHLYKNMQNSGHLRKIWNKTSIIFPFFCEVSTPSKSSTRSRCKDWWSGSCWTCLKNSPWKSKTIKVKWFCWNGWWTKPLLKPIGSMCGICTVPTYIYHKSQPFTVGKYTSPVGIRHGKQRGLYRKQPFETKNPRRWTKGLPGNSIWGLAFDAQARSFTIRESS